ncbi:outer membrane beta-barrel protein [Sphingomicrobium sp. XHP0235]|uniref:outer membrane protein n=1 Tax=Sphingomicrobium aquimarinum TaxID=3133971 RepID=UPI0031FEAC2C
MQSTIIYLAGAALTLPTVANAQDKGPYVGVDIGYAVSPDLDVATDTTRDDPGHIFLTDGEQLSAVAGYDFGGFRLEAEAGWSDVGVDGSQAPQNDPVGLGTYWEAEGSIKTRRLMINGLADFGGAGGIGGFVGAGIGVADMDLYVRNLPFDQPIFDDGNGGLAWQVTGGVAIPIANRVGLVARYRFLNAPDAAFTNFFGREESDTYRMHSLSAGVQFGF